MPIQVTDTHRALAASLAAAVDRPGQDVDRIARKIAEDELGALIRAASDAEATLSYSYANGCFENGSNRAPTAVIRALREALASFVS